jgi:hypothetical protein
MSFASLQSLCSVIPFFAKLCGLCGFVRNLFIAEELSLAIGQVPSVLTAKKNIYPEKNICIALQRLCVSAKQRQKVFRQHL